MWYDKEGTGCRSQSVHHSGMNGELVTEPVPLLIIPHCDTEGTDIHTCTISRLQWELCGAIAAVILR